MTAPAIDAGHLWPDDVWAAVVAQAEQEAARIAAGERAPEAPVQLVEAERYATGAVPLSGVVTAARHGGARPRGGPTFGVLHSAETPLVAGYAASIARMFATTTQDKSCHYMVDPAESWGVLPDELVAWHCGNGNTNSIGVEQAGYASLSKADWLSPAGRLQMARLVVLMRGLKARYGIGLWWMSDQQLRDAHAGRIVGGWATHDQCRRVLGGTTHTDPMPNYPMAELMAMANGEDDDVALSDADKEWLKDWVGWEAYATMPSGPNAGQKVLAGVQMRDTFLRVQALAAQVPALSATVAGLSTTVATLAAAVKTGTPVDVPALLKQVDGTVRQALKDGAVQVDVHVNGPVAAGPQPQLGVA